MSGRDSIAIARGSLWISLADEGELQHHATELEPSTVAGPLFPSPLGRRLPEVEFEFEDPA
jgi:hypothetical protein